MEGIGTNSSGDIFLAFSTAAKIPQGHERLGKPATGQKIDLLEDVNIDSLFEVRLTLPKRLFIMFFAWRRIRGPAGREAKALDLEKLRRLMAKYE